MIKAIYNLEKLVCVKIHDEEEERPNCVELVFEGGEKLDKVFSNYYLALDFGRKVAGGFKTRLEIE